jgi:hypothetical protein
MSEDKTVPESASPDGNTVPETPEAAAPDIVESTDESRRKRRHFMTGVITTLGAVGGAALLGSQKAESAEDDAIKLRSQIVGRIQEELKRSRADLMNNYDKPDSPTGTHGRYLKSI